MHFELNPEYQLDKSVYETKKASFQKVKELNELFLNETYLGNKVAYYYENIKTGDSFAFNTDRLFYAASTIKILTCLLFFEKASNNEIDLDRELLITSADLKPGTGIIKNQSEDTKYSILDLIRLTIVESDNTAYLKLVSLVGKDKIKEYGNSLGAIHTMEGKETDSFGLVNTSDMIIYLKKIKSFIDNNPKYGALFKDYLLNPSYKIVNDDTIGNNKYYRKYGFYDIAYHEVGFVNDDYFVIILTQLGTKDYRDSFINTAFLKIANLHESIESSQNDGIMDL